MNKTSKKGGSTQKFTEIVDVRDNVVIFTGQQAAMVMSVQAINFLLLSYDEQMAKIASYASLLNAVSFPIQILVHSKRVDISSYLKTLDYEMQKTPNEKLQAFIKQYRDFVSELIRVNTVLDKEFYIVIPYSSLEQGVSGVVSKGEGFLAAAKATLTTKADSLLSQLARLNLRARILTTQELIKLYYEIYNQDVSASVLLHETIQAPIVRMQKGEIT